MRLFFEIASRAFRRHLTYRAATIVGLITNVVFGLLRASVLSALTGDQPQVNGWDARDVVTYVALTQAVIMFVSIFGWTDLMNAVYRGEISSDLLRPTNLFAFWLAQDVGRAIAALLLRGVTIMLICAMLFRISAPSSLLQWVALAVSMTLGLLISFSFRFIVNLAAFWSPDARGIGRFAFTVAVFASGFLMPLRFFPDWLQTALSFTPFPHIVNTIIEVYIGSLEGSDLLEALLQQAFWSVALITIAHVILARASRRLVILGG
jgi:ABC-2 type transport system permease protein